MVRIFTYCFDLGIDGKHGNVDEMEIDDTINSELKANGITKDELIDIKIVVTKDSYIVTIIYSD